MVRPVFYQVVEPSSIGEKRSFSGVVQARLDTKLSFKVGGMMAQMHVQMGDTVKAGDMIARLDDADYQVNFFKSEAALKNAEAQMKISESALLRMEHLYMGNSVSLSDYEGMKARHENAESMLRTARAQMTAARNQLGYTLLRAPFPGVISTVLVRENEIIGPGMPVAIVASAKDPEVATAVPESIIGRIKQGDQVTVHVTSPKASSLTGVISELSPGTASLSAYPVVIRLNATGDHLLPGMTCTVVFSLAEKGLDRDNAVLTIAADAVGKDHSGHFVYIAEETDTPDIYSAVKKTVAVGQLKPDGYEIMDGVAVGDLVITAGLSFLQDGKKVKLMKDE